MKFFLQNFDLTGNWTRGSWMTIHLSNHCAIELSTISDKNWLSIWTKITVIIFVIEIAVNFFEIAVNFFEIAVNFFEIAVNFFIVWNIYLFFVAMGAGNRGIYDKKITFYVALCWHCFQRFYAIKRNLHAYICNVIFMYNLYMQITPIVIGLFS